MATTEPENDTELEFYAPTEQMPQIPNIGSSRFTSMVGDVFERFLHARQSEKARHWQSFDLKLAELMTYVAELEQTHAP